jgi:hypothetical protein
MPEYGHFEHSFLPDDWLFDKNSKIGVLSGLATSRRNANNERLVVFS